MKKLWVSVFNLRDHHFDARLNLAIVAAITIFTLVPFFTAIAQEEGQEDDAITLEEITVSSSRIKEDGFEAPTPTTKVTIKTAKDQGLINIADLINQSPAFMNSETPASRTTGLGGSNVGNYLNMRSLGTERTLLLLNGNRIVPSSNNGTTDLNLIPTISLQRADVVTGGASAAWGSDAVSGVVNLITKKDFEGFEAEVRGGQTTEGDGDTKSFSILFGKKLNDKTNLMFATEYEDNEGGGLLNSRDWSTRMVGQIAGVGGTRVTVPNIQFGGVFSPGGHILGPPFAFGGQNIGADGQTIAPPADPGIQYTGGPAQSGGDYRFSHPVGMVQLTTPVERYSALLSMDTEFSDTLRGALELNYGHYESEFPSVPFIGVQALHADNPYLPAALAAVMTGPVQPVGKIGTIGMPAYQRGVEQETLRILAKIEGEFSNDWGWDAHYSYGNNNLYSFLENVLTYANADQSLFPASQSPLNLAVDAVDDGSGNIVCRSGAPGCVPFNFLGIGTYDQAALDYITGVSWYEATNKQHNFAVNVTGKLGSTPAGPISVAAGYEYRVDEISGTSDEQSQNDLFDVFNRKPIDGSLDVNEAYLEVLVPLLADKPFAEALDLNAAVRRAEYELAGGATTWKLGATYNVNNQFRLRASTSRDIRAPNLIEVFQSGQTGQAGNIPGYVGSPNPALILRTISGNPGLTPEESDTVSFGFSYRPDFLAGFFVGVDYYDISIDNAIIAPGVQDLIMGCVAGNTDYCSQVDFDPTDPTNTTVLMVREQPLNVDSLTASGIDIELGYDFFALDGEFAVRVLGTYVDEISDTGSGGYNRAGQIGPGALSRSVIFSPEWIVDSNVRYQRNAFGINLHWHYIDSGVIDVTAEPGGVNAGKMMSLLSGTLTQDNSVESTHYIDLAVDYTFERINGSSIQVFAGGKNIFNTDPPEEFGMSSFGGSRLGGLYDPLGSSYFAGVRFEF